MRPFYELSLWIPQCFLLAHPDFHHRLLSVIQPLILFLLALLSRHVPLLLLAALVAPLDAQVKAPDAGVLAFSTAIPKSATPTITSVTISPNTVNDLHLAPLYAATIRMPEAVSSVVVGAPSLFQAEHSEREEDLVIVKPITDEPATSNLLIATKSGQTVSLRLLSDGANSGSSPVDFVVIYKYRRSFLIGGLEESAPEDRATARLAPYDLAYKQQEQLSSPPWMETKGPFTASLGSVTVNGTEMVVAFSVLNRSDRWIDLLPPQIELSNPSAAAKQQKGEAAKDKKRILADQVAIIEYRVTQARLAPGTRSDGVLRFARPDTKQHQENLELALAISDAIDHPLIISVPFTAPPANATQLQAQR